MGHDRRDVRLVTGSVLAGSLVPLNSTMIVVALADIGHSFGVSKSSTAVLVTAYLVAMLVLQPLGGRAGDRLGATAVTRGALAGFAVTSAVTAAAPSFALLLAGRCGQALFGAALIPNLQATLRRAIPADRRGRVFGTFSAGVGAGAAVGPLLGGLLVAVWGWRALLPVSVPICLAALFLLGGATADRPDPDAATGGLAAGPAPARWTELARPGFVAACAAQATSNFCMYSVLLVAPLLLSGRHWHAGAIGAAVFAMTAGMVLFPPVGGRLADTRGRSAPVVGGFAAAALGAAVMAAAVSHPGAFIAGMAVVGAGTGVAVGSLQAAAMEAVPAAAAGTAGGVFSTVRYLGSIAASAAVAGSAVGEPAGARAVLVAAVVVMAVAVAAGSRVDAGDRSALRTVWVGPPRSP